MKLQLIKSVLCDLKKSDCNLGTTFPLKNMSKIHWEIRHRRYLSVFLPFLLWFCFSRHMDASNRIQHLLQNDTAIFVLSFSLSFSRGSFRLRSLFPGCLLLGEACAGWLCFKKNKQEEITSTF